MSRLAHEWRQAVGSISTKSFLNPFLWMCGLVSLPSFILAYVASSPLNYAFLVIGLVPLTLIVFLTLKYSVRPELFQSEDYRLKDRALRIFGDSQSDNIEGLARIVTPESPYPLLDAREIRKELDQ